jgi:hypothetical protein
MQSFIENVNSRRAVSPATTLSREYPGPLVARHEADPSIEPDTQHSVQPHSPTSSSSAQSSPVVTLPADSLSLSNALMETAQRLELESPMPMPTAEATPKVESMPTPIAEAAPEIESESTRPDVSEAALWARAKFPKAMPTYTAEQCKAIYESMFSSLCYLNPLTT